MSSAKMFLTVCTVLSLFSLSFTANVVVKKIEVQMGSIGSDDDIRIKMCEGSKFDIKPPVYGRLQATTFLFEVSEDEIEKWVYVEVSQVQSRVMIACDTTVHLHIACSKSTQVSGLIFDNSVEHGRWYIFVWGRWQ